MNSTRLEDLAKGGKIYLSLSDAVVLALENNYDIAIQRFNIDIADTDILRAKSGADVVGRAKRPGREHHRRRQSALAGKRRRPGRVFGRCGWRRRRHGGTSLTTNGLGPQPEVLDPTLTGTIQLQRQTQPTASSFSGPVVNTHTERVQLHLYPGLDHRHATSGGLQQQPDRHQTRRLPPTALPCSPISWRRSLSIWPMASGPGITSA